MTDTNNSSQLGYFEWVPGGAPFREEIQHGVYTGILNTTWFIQVYLCKYMK